jgi:hypothetical protein
MDELQIRYLVRFKNVDILHVVMKHERLESIPEATFVHYSDPPASRYIIEDQVPIAKHFSGHLSFYIALTRKNYQDSVILYHGFKVLADVKEWIADTEMPLLRFVILMGKDVSNHKTVELFELR